MKPKSNLQLKSNLVVESVDGTEVTNAKLQIRYFPGDFAGLIDYRMRDTRLKEKVFTPQQIREHRQIIICLDCKKPCAGTCKRVY
jgi:hypothetical protein